MLPILAVLLFGSTPLAGPLVVNTPSVDRGEVSTGPPLIQVFELTHSGTSDTLTITGVEAGCGCLKPILSREVLRPGETIKLTATLNTLTQPPGPNAWKLVVRYRITSSTAGPSPPAVKPDSELELKVSARLVQVVSVTPPVLAISTTSAITQTITVTDRRETPLTVRSATSTNPHLIATVKPATGTTPRTQTVDVTVTEAYPPGATDETLVLLTTDQTCPELRVPIRLTKRKPGSLTITPDAPEVRFAQSQEEASTLVQVRRPNGGNLRVERVESDHPALRGKWSAPAGPVATIRVIADRQKAAGRGGRADLRVVMAEPAGEVIVLPVSWTVPD
jgi:hypothetical protein